MRPSLEAVGRYDPIRARNRFLATYNPRDTQILCAGSGLVGFFVLRFHYDHLHLDHVYIRPKYQRRGFGCKVMCFVKCHARAKQLPVRVTALRDSAANEFYLSCGFELQRTEGFDNYYIWRPLSN